MIFRAIIILCVLITFITIYATLRSAYKPDKNLFMAVTLPNDVLKGEFVKSIQKEYKSLCNKIYLLMILTAIPMIFPFWIFENTTVYIFYMAIWCLFFAYYGVREPFKKMHRKVKAEKHKNQWFIVDKNCDTDTTLEKESNCKNLIVDEDDYWIDGIYYCNPNDKRTVVNSRFGYSTTYNIATKHGYFMAKKLDKIILIVTAIIMAVLLIPNEFTNSEITFNTTSPNISISCFPYSYELNYENIESITITDEPISFKLRTNGISTEEKLIGNFKSTKYGKCRVYLYPKDNNEYIVAKLKNAKHDYLIYNTKDKAATQKAYQKISQNIK